VRLEWVMGDNGRPAMREIPGSEFELDVDLVLLALGFLGPERPGLLTDLGVQLNERGNVAVQQSWMTTVPGVFSCGDMRRGQSLVVWAIWEGRECARGVDQFLMGHTDLPASPDPF
jgi:glutamate synthase (NADPH/NADH) small chain